MFYHMQADGFSLDDKRELVETNDIGDVLVQWQQWKAVRDQFAESKSKLKEFRNRTAKAFAVPVQEIRDNKYDLSINRYKEIEYEAVDYDSRLEILDQLEALEAEITSDLQELRADGDVAIVLAGETGEVSFRGPRAVFVYRDGAVASAAWPAGIRHQGDDGREVTSGHGALDPETGDLWGNFPQTYSMVGLITSAMRLSKSWEEAF